MSEKVTRKEKIEYFYALYREQLTFDDTSNIVILNQIIIDSVGISGLKQVKKNAWNEGEDEN